MKTVWRYDLRHAHAEVVRLVDPKVVLVAAPPGDIPANYEPTVWIEHHPDHPDPFAEDLWMTWEIEFVGTGHPVPEDATHAGSCVVGPFVWHVYVRRVR